MKEYVFLLLGAVIISGAVNMLAPDGAVKPYVALLVSICLLSAALGPIGELIAHVQDAELIRIPTQNTDIDYEKVYREALVAGNEASFCELLKVKMIRELHIDAQSFGLLADIELSDGEYVLKKLTVILRGSGITQDPERLREYTRSLFGLECEIIYE